MNNTHFGIVVLVDDVLHVGQRRGSARRLWRRVVVLVMVVVVVVMVMVRRESDDGVPVVIRTGQR